MQIFVTTDFFKKQSGFRPFSLAQMILMTCSKGWGGKNIFLSPSILHIKDLFGFLCQFHGIPREFQQRQA